MRYHLPHLLIGFCLLGVVCTVGCQSRRGLSDANDSVASSVGSDLEENIERVPATTTAFVGGRRYGRVGYLLTEEPVDSRLGSPRRDETGPAPSSIFVPWKGVYAELPGGRYDSPAERLEIESGWLQGGIHIPQESVTQTDQAIVPPLVIDYLDVDGTGMVALGYIRNRTFYRINGTLFRHANLTEVHRAASVANAVVIGSSDIGHVVDILCPQHDLSEVKQALAVLGAPEPFIAAIKSADCD